MNRQRAVACVFVLLSAFGGVFVGVPIPLRVVCATVGIVLVGWLSANAIARGEGSPRTTDGLMAVIVLAIITGLLLTYLPAGITRHSLAVTWCVIGVALTAVGVGRQQSFANLGAARPDEGRSFGALIAACLVVAAAGAAALVIGMSGVHRVQSRPFLALSAVSYGGHNATVQIAERGLAGSYRLSVLLDGVAGSGYEKQLELAETTTMERVLSLPPTRCYWQIVIARQGNPSPSRFVKVWVGNSSAGLLRAPASAQPLAGSGQACRAA